MTAIDAAFRRLRESGEKGLVVYLTAGDPDAGGVPPVLPGGGGRRGGHPRGGGSLFRSHGGRPDDRGGVAPGADGRHERRGGARARPEAPQDALDAGRPVRVLQPVFPVRKAFPVRDARAAGVDGFLIVDLPFEESGRGRVGDAEGGTLLDPARGAHQRDRPDPRVRPRRLRLHVPHLGHRRDGRQGNAAAGDASWSRKVEGDAAPAGRRVRHLDPGDGARGDPARRRRGRGKRLRQDRGTEREVPAAPRSFPGSSGPSNPP